MFKKITGNKTSWHLLSSTETDSYVQVYCNNQKLILLNHADDFSFGGVGFDRMKNGNRIDKFVNLLRKLINKKKSDQQAPVEINEVQMIGCDLNKYMAQQIADDIKLPVKTLRDLHSEEIFKCHGSGKSKLVFSKDLSVFCYGFIFNNPDSFEGQHPDYLKYAIQESPFIPSMNKVFVHNMNDWWPIHDLFDYLENPENHTVHIPKTTIKKTKKCKCDGVKSEKFYDNGTWFSEINVISCSRCFQQHIQTLNLGIQKLEQKGWTSTNATSHQREAVQKTKEIRDRLMSDYM